MAGKKSPVGKKGKQASVLQSRVVMAGRLTILLGGVLIVGFSSAYMGMRFAVRGSEVKAPALAGKLMQEAQPEVDARGLSLRVIGERFDPEIPKGSVISQLPTAGGRIKSGGEVQVIVSRGEKRNPVPELRGSTLRVARLVAAQAGYEMGHISRLASPGGEDEEVLQQFPLPASQDTLTTQIDVLVRSGTPRRYVMPDVTGQRLNRVLLFFERHQLELGEVQYTPYGRVARGTVVKQFPEPGHLLAEGSTINLEVAR